MPSKISKRLELAQTICTLAGTPMGQCQHYNWNARHRKVEKIRCKRLGVWKCYNSWAIDKPNTCGWHMCTWHVKNTIAWEVGRCAVHLPTGLRVSSNALGDDHFAERARAITRELLRIARYWK